MAEPPRRAPATRSRRLLIVGLTLISAMVGVALTVHWLTPYDPATIVVPHYTGPLPPGGPYVLGTDTLGRDQWTRLAYGARTSLVVGSIAMVISLAIGVTVGLLAGYFGGWVDAALMWTVDLVLTMPTLLLLIVLATVLPPSLLTIPLVIGVVGWTTFARTVRGEVLSLKERDYLLAARALGASHSRVVVRHLLPGVLPSVIVLAALGMSGAVSLDAGLSYLGLGVPLPTPSWGRMISEAQTYFAVAPWLVVFPGMAIALTVVGFYLVGQGLTELLEARRA